MKTLPAVKISGDRDSWFADAGEYGRLPVVHKFHWQTGSMHVYPRTMSLAGVRSSKTRCWADVETWGGPRKLVADVHGLIHIGMGLFSLFKGVG
jgi:hypothetical protein